MGNSPPCVETTANEGKKKKRQNGKKGLGKNSGKERKRSSALRKQGRPSKKKNKTSKCNQKKKGRTIKVKGRLGARLQWIIKGKKRLTKK